MTNDAATLVLDCPRCQATFASRPALLAHCTAAHLAEQDWWTVLPLKKRLADQVELAEKQRVELSQRAGLVMATPEKGQRRQTDTDRQTRNTLVKMAKRLTLSRLAAR